MARFFYFGGRERDRTDDPHNAIVVLYQLSYAPVTNKSRRNYSHSARAFAMATHDTLCVTTNN